MKNFFTAFAMQLGTTVGFIVTVVALLISGSVLWSLLIGTSLALLISLLLPLYYLRSERSYKKLADKVNEPKLLYEWIKLVKNNVAYDARMFMTDKSIFLMSLGKGRNFRVQIPKSMITDVSFEGELHLHINYQNKDQSGSVHILTPCGEKVMAVLKENGFLK